MTGFEIFMELYPIGFVLFGFYASLFGMKGIIEKKPFTAEYMDDNGKFVKKIKLTEHEAICLLMSKEYRKNDWTLNAIENFEKDNEDGLKISNYTERKIKGKTYQIIVRPKKPPKDPWKNEKIQS